MWVAVSLNPTVGLESPDIIVAMMMMLEFSAKVFRAIIAISSYLCMHAQTGLSNQSVCVCVCVCMY